VIVPPGQAMAPSMSDMAPGARHQRRLSVEDLIRLEEGLAQEMIMPYMTPSDYISGLWRFSARLGRQDCKDYGLASSISSEDSSVTGSFGKCNLPVANQFEEFAPGMRCTVVSPVTVRKGESLETAVVAEIEEIGIEVSILAVGEGRRAQIHALKADVVGWVSVKTKSGQPLLATIPASSTACKEPCFRDRFKFGH